MGDLRVQPINLLNLAVLRQASQTLAPLSYPEIAFSTPNGGWQAIVPYGRRRVRTYVATGNGGCGLAVLRQSRNDFRWELVSLGASGEPSGVIEHWLALLAESNVAAGLDGAKRLHADSPLDGPVHETLVRAGYSVYAHETILLAQGLHRGEGEEPRLRAQEPSDAWSIHHLYHLLTPKAVQYAEAFSSNHWRLSRLPRSNEHGYVLDGRQGLEGYCRVTTAGRQAALEILIAPDRFADLTDLVAESLRLAGAGLDGRVWARVPGYLGEYVAPLEEAGFQAVEQRALMVRYTGVPLAIPQQRRLTLVRSVTERLPARVPAPVGSNLRS